MPRVSPADRSVVKQAHPAGRLGRRNEESSTGVGRIGFGDASLPAQRGTPARHRRRAGAADVPGMSRDQSGSESTVLPEEPPCARPLQRKPSMDRTLAFRRLLASRIFQAALLTFPVAVLAGCNTSGVDSSAPRSPRRGPKTACSSTRQSPRSVASRSSSSRSGRRRSSLSWRIKPPSTRCATRGSASGRLPEAEVQATAARALLSVVLPAARALLAISVG